MEYQLFADGIDGVHGLRRRERTRLWYRSSPSADIIPDHLRAAIANALHLTVTAPDLVEVVRIKAIPPGTAGEFDQFIVEQTGEMGRTVHDGQHPNSTQERQERILKRLGSNQDVLQTIEAPETPEAAEVAVTGWRYVPRNAPTLLLASTRLLDGRKPGPILGPGCEYRVMNAGEGVVRLQVRSAGGEISVGYCNAMDLTCIEPMVANLADARWRVSTRERLRKITRGLSAATGSFAGLSS